MSATPALVAQARAAHILCDRRHLVAIVEMCLQQIRAKDHLLGQIAPALSAAAFAEIYGAHEKQDARLHDALASIFGSTPPPRDEIRYEPDPEHAGSLREIHHHLTTHPN